MRLSDVAPTRTSTADADFLAEAVALAESGRFAVEPNPLVGAVVARAGRVVGHGWHEAYGGPHAEVAALANAGRRARGATVYVSLEPCTTTGKTPPCVEALARAGVRRVVWAARDPDPRHRGLASLALAAHGIESAGPVRTPGASDVLAPFRRALALDRPWVLAKWAASLDGRVATATGAWVHLSGPVADRFVHEIRGRVEAVAVGIRTVLADDPRLTCRLPEGPPDGRRQPAAVVFDSRARTPVRSRLVRLAARGRPLILFVARAPARRVRALASRPGVEVVVLPSRDGRVDVAEALRHLHLRGVRRLLVEGGPVLHGAMFAHGLVDQVAAISTPTVLGTDGAPPAIAGTPFRDVESAPHLAKMRARRLGDDVLVEGYVERATEP